MSAPKPHPFIRERRYEARLQDVGKRLDRFVVEMIPRLSRTRARSAIQAGGIDFANNERKAKPSSTLQLGDVVSVRESFESEVVQWDQVRVLAETPRFLAIDKPAGMLTHPTATAYRNTALTWAQLHGWPDALVAHRIDRDTSGVLLLALGEAGAALSQAFEEGRVQKSYLAVVVDSEHRHEVGAQGSTDAPLGLNPQSLLPHLEMGRGSLQCSTAWRVLRRTDDLALLEVVIEGGRQHQIRAHMALFGTPLAGDGLYRYGAEFYIDLLEGRGDRSTMRAPRHALHAHRVRFTDADQDWTIEAPVPALFDALVAP